MLSSYLNVYNTCVVILKRKGYQLSFERSTTTETWKAARGDFQFVADNPIELLGLTGIYDELNPAADTEYWWRLQEPDVLSELEGR